MWIVMWPFTVQANPLDPALAILCYTKWFSSISPIKSRSWADTLAVCNTSIGFLVLIGEIVSFSPFYCLEHLPPCFIHALVSSLLVIILIWLLIFCGESWHLAQLFFVQSPCFWNPYISFFNNLWLSQSYLGWSWLVLRLQLRTLTWYLKATSGWTMEPLVMSSHIQTVWIMVFTHLLLT